jgi:hypothetical protein
MTTYNVNVQGTFYKTFEFDGEGYDLPTILAQVNADKVSGDLIVDESQPIGVSVTAVDSNP